jgi:hypothetical protein
MILCIFQKFWNRCFGSCRHSVRLPDILDKVLCVKQRVCARFRKFWNRCLFGDIIFPNSRNSGIGILVTQKFCGWVQVFWTYPVYWLVQMFCETSRYFGLGDWYSAEILWTFQIVRDRDFPSDNDFVHFPEILESVFWVVQTFCETSRYSG